MEKVTTSWTKSRYDYFVNHKFDKHIKLISLDLFKKKLYRDAVHSVLFVLISMFSKYWNCLNHFQ